VHGILVSALGPLHEDEGGDGDVIIELDIPDELFTTYEWTTDHEQPYREAMIPAAELNLHVATGRCLTEDEQHALLRARWHGRVRTLR
jgi:hypothetical protein